MTDLERRRREFERADWVRGADCYPENPKADPSCRKCNGHGILDDGDLAFMPVNCDVCWKRVNALKGQKRRRKMAAKAKKATKSKAKSKAKESKPKNTHSCSLRQLRG